MEPLVRVFGQHQPGEQTRGLFRLRNFLAAFVSVLFETLSLADRLEIHFAIRRVEVREFARQSFTENVTRDFARLIDLRQRETRQRQTGRCARNRDFRFCIVPTSQQIATEFLIGARPLHLIENEFVIFFDRFDDLSELAHCISPLIGSPFGAPYRVRFEINSNNRSTPESRCRFATVSTSCWSRRFCSRRCSISECAVRARWRSLLFTTTMSARSSITIFCNCNRLP